MNQTKRVVLLAGLIVLAASIGFGQEKKEEAPKEPVITADFKARFFKAQSELNQAELAMERTKEWQQHEQKAAVFQGITREFTALCSAKMPALDVNGDPKCLAKLEPAKPVATPAVPAKK